MKQKDVVIIGGGISGLSLAHFLKKQGKEVLLVEKKDRVGGVIQSIHQDGFLLELGPSSCMGYQGDIKALIEEVGLSDQVVFASESSKKRYLYHQKKLHSLPMSPAGLMKSPLLSLRGKWNLMMEPLRGRGSSSSESVYDFFKRRIGLEATETFVEPFCSGVYAGDIEKLSLRHAFPMLYELEKKAGSLLKGFIKWKGPKKDRRLFSFQGGLEMLPQAIEKELRTIVNTSSHILKIDQQKKGFVTLIGSGETAVPVQSKVLVFATPAGVTAQMLQRFNPDLATKLVQVDYAPVIVYHMGFKRDQVGRLLDGFGFLVPRKWRLRTLGVLWNSSLFEKRAPEGHVLFTVMAGGARDKETFQLDPEQSAGLITQELSNMLSISGPPAFIHEVRHHKAIPQYTLGHEEVVKSIASFHKKFAGLYIAGNFISGVSVPQCVESSKALSDSIASYLSSQNS